jgi:NAD(P)-dependent dehydrogenase (short-subunit alcohol dehydrogenase family)
MSSHSLSGKVAVVAGGAKNLGGTISRDFARSGIAAVAVHYNSDATRSAAEETAAAVEAAGARAIAVQGDLTRPANVARLFDEAIKAFGKIDIAVNTAGIVVKKPIVEITEKEYDDSFAINAKAAFFFIQEAGKKLANGGNIVTIVTSLLAAYTTFYAVYPASKAAVEHFTRAASKEFGERGISVNAIGPGPMDTPFFYPAESKESAAYHATAAALSKHTKTGLTDIEDIAPIVKFLVTDGWWITGQTLFANGGYTTR